MKNRIRQLYHFLMWRGLRAWAKAHRHFFGYGDAYIHLHLAAIQHHDEYIEAVVLRDRDFLKF